MLGNDGDLFFGIPLPHYYSKPFLDALEGSAPCFAMETKYTIYILVVTDFNSELSLSCNLHRLLREPELIDFVDPIIIKVDGDVFQ